MKEYTITIEYDDQAYDIIDKINDVLEEHGISMEVENEYHVGFDIVHIKINN